MSFPWTNGCGKRKRKVREQRVFDVGVAGIADGQSCNGAGSQRLYAGAKRLQAVRNRSIHALNLAGCGFRGKHVAARIFFNLFRIHDSGSAEYFDGEFLWNVVA